MGGSADVVAGAYEHTIRMQQRGQPIKGFALIGRGMQLAIGLRNDVAEKVKGPADIKGMKFGVTAPGSQTHMLVNNWAAKGGLKPTDIVAIGVGAGASVVAAIENKSVDGISQSDPALTILQEKNLIKIVVDTRTMKGNQELFGGSMPGGLPLCPAGAAHQDAEHGAGAGNGHRARRRVAADGGAVRRRQGGARGLSAGRPGDLREGLRQRARDDLARRHHAGRRSGQLPEVPGRGRSQDRSPPRSNWPTRGPTSSRNAPRSAASPACRSTERRRSRWPTSPAASPPAKGGGEPYTAVADATLAVAKGEFVSVVGPTGCGKSTLLNVAAGLLEPSSGTVEVFGERLVAAAGVNRRAGYMFQADALMPWRTGIGNVVAGLEFRGVPRCPGNGAGRGMAAPGRPGGFRRSLPAPDVGRHAQAPGAGPDPDPESRHPADGRAVLGARRADPPAHGERAAGPVGRGQEVGAVHHPRPRGGDCARRPRHRAVGRAGDAADRRLQESSCPGRATFRRSA